MKNKKLYIMLVAVFVVMVHAVSASALDFDFSGTFRVDNEIQRFDFTVGNATPSSLVTVFSSSWDDGGFDPILAIWDSAGFLMEQQDDGYNIGSTMSNGVVYSHGTWDSWYQVVLNPGNYIATIGQYNNFANGLNLSLGFQHDDNPNFTYDEWGGQPYFNGVWNNPLPDPRTGNWAFHLVNVASVTTSNTVPEPGTMLLLGSGLAGLAGLAAIRRRKR